MFEYAVGIVAGLIIGCLVTYRIMRNSKKIADGELKFEYSIRGKMNYEIKIFSAKHFIHGKNILVRINDEAQIDN